MRALALLSLALATPAAAAPDRLATAIEGRTAGKPISCVPLFNLKGPTIVDDATLIYRSRGTIYVNRIPGGCAGLRPGRALVTRTPTGNLCSGDIATIVDPPLPGSYGSCALGTFTPYRR